MTIQEMRGIIVREELEGYNRFYFGTIYIGENCISMKSTSNGQYEICITGEHGKHTIHILSESEAYVKVIDYLRFGKEMSLKNDPRW